ncbi:MAG: LAGLIDADG family homing endonuclease [Candidatus Caldarchaeum sp.]
MLRSRGLSYNRIFEAMRERYGVMLNKSHISYWVRGLHSPYNGITLPSTKFLKPSRELAYVVGVVVGDGYIRRKQRPRKSYHGVFIGLKVKDREFAEEFAKCLARVMRRDPPKPKWSKRTFVVELRCKPPYELLKKPLYMDKIKKFIEYDRKCKYAFLRGFFGSEGCVSKDGTIIDCNTDLRLLGYVRRLLDSLGIETSGPHLSVKHGTACRDPRKGKTYKRKKDTYSLYVPAGLRLRFFKHIGFTIKRKQQRLEDYLVRTRRLKPPAKHSPIFPSF